MKRQYVYVVAIGERGEGQQPESAWTTLRQARRAVFDKYDYEVTKFSGGAWMVSLNGVDQVWIHRLPLGGAS